MREEELYRAL